MLDSDFGAIRRQNQKIQPLKPPDTTKITSSTFRNNEKIMFSEGCCRAEVAPSLRKQDFGILIFNIIQILAYPIPRSADEIDDDSEFGVVRRQNH